MKDLHFTLTGRRQKHEIITFTACVAIAFLLNAYAIYRYGSPWSELLSSIFYVLIFAVLLYCLWTIVRILWHAITRKTNSNKNTRS